ncbi:hypothetical protein MGL_2002 [Malassezia globosa CBS 7966]|uniref:DUF423 domain-containing protein n=1 Tax=Malassezia globosa (strain ATCC MYA-4612 / CBS 7966) TaxID=425265 RepID=A8Q099_MALGO|nr:uncharacterized protein MGL_2002 [Malassezia globosa CBS 7966]EDP43789.1 hypothetical protein MGL_2002 [Malassezia globosa CBS 7966]
MSWIATFGCFSGAVSVALGAIGAHVLKPRMTPQPLVALAWSQPLKGVAFYGACGLMAGIMMFCGVMYQNCVLRPDSPLRKLGILGPFGGMSFIIGWLLLAYSKCPL